jgi:hypothetical protein
MNELSAAVCALIISCLFISVYRLEVPFGGLQLLRFYQPVICSRYFNKIQNFNIELSQAFTKIFQLVK